MSSELPRREPSAPEPEPPSPPRPVRRANDLDGREWTRLSVSVWSDLRKSPEETALQHPAMFPVELVERLIRCFTREGDGLVLDPFCGSGSTLVAALRRQKRAVGFELAADYVELAGRRCRELDPHRWQVHRRPAQQLAEVLPPESVDLCVTSPPYWDVLSRRRTADYRDVRDYAGGDSAAPDAPPADLARIEDYQLFLKGLQGVFQAVYRVLKPGAYCIINVMDLRKKDCFYPLHSDLMRELARPHGPFVLDDLIIWDRRADYNSFRPLGYPAVFRINKAHEYLLIFQKRGVDAPPEA